MIDRATRIALRRRAGLLLLLMFAASAMMLAPSVHAQTRTVLASDDFNRPPETPFEVGSDWLKAAGAGSANLTSSQVAGVSGEAVYAWQGSGSFDDSRQYARARVVQATAGEIGLALLGANGQAIIVAWEGNTGTVLIFWYVGGTPRPALTTAPSPIQPGDLIEAELQGGTIYAKVNGTVVASAANTTSLTSGRPGFQTFLSGGVIDDWEAGTPAQLTLGGTITDGALPLQGVLVRTSGRVGKTTTTDANGQYLIGDLPSGATAIRVTPNLAGYTASPLTRTVAGPIAANVTGQDFTSTPSSNPVIAFDDFDRGVELPLVVGGNWQKVAGAGFANLSGDQLVGIDADAVYVWQGPGVFDDTRQYARARVTNTTGQVGLALLGAPGQAIVAAWDRSISTLYLYWYSGGAIQGNLVTASSIIQAGDVLEAELLDGRIYAKVNGTVVASAVNTTTLTAGRPGFEVFRANGRLDDWEAGTPTTYTISGTITENAVGLPGVLVSASGNFGGTTTTDANGHYSFTGVPAGATSIVLVPNLVGHTLSPLTRIVAGPIAGPVTGEDFTSTPSSNPVVAFDGFNRPDELPLLTSGSWQKVAGAGTVQLSNDEIVGTGADAVYVWQGPGVFDDTRQYARTRVTNTTGQVGLALLGAPGQAIVAAWDRSISTLYLYWYSAGAIQGNLATIPSTIQVGDVLEAELLDGTIYAKVNGTVVASAANTTTLTSGKPGFEMFRAGGRIDDWEAGTPPAYTISGTITESAVGLPGVLVSASGHFGGTTTTDANGQYSFSGVPAGATSIVLVPNLVGHTLSPPTRAIAGPVAGNVLGQDFTSTPSTNPVVAFDDFNRPDEIPLLTDGNWQKAVGAGLANLSNDALIGAGGADAVYFWQGPGAFSDTRQYARARVTNTSAQVGLALLADNGHALVAAWNGATTNFFLYWYSGGTNQGNLATATSAIQAGDILEIQLVDGAVTAKVNGVVVASATKPALLTTGRPGFETFLAGGRLDDWEAGIVRVACEDGLDNDGDGFADLADPGCASSSDPSEQNPLVACDDGVDDDGDTLIDLLDPGCSSPADASEQNAAIACDDGVDNDGDGLADLADPGCTGVGDGSEQNAAIACDDGTDNDGDGLADLTDPGCASPTDASEQNAAIACDDGVDNDGDGLADLADPGCANATDPSERSATLACDDGTDNDGDSLIDLNDPGCSSPTDPSEGNAAIACDDGVDNDGDLFVDLADPGCANATDASESNAAIACDDGTDNDGDALVDLADPGCANVFDASEQNAAIACDDGVDNDLDGLADLADPGCANGSDASEQNAAIACDDGVDNDGDGLADLADPGCANGSDASEQNAAIACDDGLDNDVDGLVDLADPGCSNGSDASEQNTAIACDDGTDNDGDALVDLADPGCTGPTDTSEGNAAIACDDGTDNDGDGLIDLADPGCANGADASERNAAIACDDGLDNDGDALVDLADPGCTGPTDASEQNAAIACDDGTDNDGDGLVDLADPGCASGADASEQNAAIACDDGIDNDGDGSIDLADPGCANATDASERNESVACDDGLDNDSDLLIDWPADPGCESATDASEGVAPPAVPGLPPTGWGLLVAALLATGWAAGRAGSRGSAEQRS
ncbi:MAG: hypothetical protein U0900_01865 [Myxococcota bacterium]